MSLSQEQLTTLKRIRIALGIIFVITLVILYLELSKTTYAITGTEVEKPGRWDAVRNEISLSETSNESDKKLSAFLQSYHSAFTQVPLFTIGRAEGLTNDQIILLIGISYQESKLGTVYRKKGGAFTDARNYFNATGIKSLPGCENQKLPDSNGMYITKCSSWHQFWQSYMRQIKKAYFDKRCDTAMCMRNWYVGGSSANKINWVRGVNGAIKRIKAYGI